MIELTANRLRYGSVSILAKLLGIKTSQLSAWFNISRQTSPQNVERIARSVGISIAEVNAAANARRQDLALTKQLDRDTEDKIKPPSMKGLGVCKSKRPVQIMPYFLQDCDTNVSRPCFATKFLFVARKNHAIGSSGSFCLSRPSLVFWGMDRTGQ